MKTLISYSLITKPAGPLCNLACKYCFYLGKKSTLFPDVKSFKMDYEILEAYICQNIQSQDVSKIQFSWQGGEPTLLGVDFFKDVVRLQKKHANGKSIVNNFQTNGTLLNNQWCSFLGANDFLVGISIDGPKQFHDRYRRDKKDQPTFQRVMKGIKLLKKHKVRFNIMAVVNDYNSRHPVEIYDFFKHTGDGFIQFIPLVETIPTNSLQQTETQLTRPPDSQDQTYENFRIAPFSVKPEQFADFYIKIFDKWVAQDVGSVFVQFFDAALGNWMGMGSGLCQFAASCDNTGAIEHNGDLYACDHYVYPEYLIGNIKDKPLKDLLSSEKQKNFALQKIKMLPQYCLECTVLNLCNGDCPKHRFTQTSKGEPGLSYLCTSYKKIFKHMAPSLQKIEDLICSGRQASEIMNKNSSQTKKRKIKPNEKCPCKSGRKYKKCCGF